MNYDEFRRKHHSLRYAALVNHPPPNLSFVTGGTSQRAASAIDLWFYECHNNHL